MRVKGALYCSEMPLLTRDFRSELELKGQYFTIMRVKAELEETYQWMLPVNES